jgi:hypothetical protein
MTVTPFRIYVSDEVLGDLLVDRVEVRCVDIADVVARQEPCMLSAHHIVSALGMGLAKA